MARPRTGTIRRRPSSRGIGYGVQFRYRGEAHYVHFGGSWEGWTEERVETERVYLMKKVNRGEWAPPRRRRNAVEAPAVTPTYQLVASEWLEHARKRMPDPDGEKARKEVRNLEWRLSIGMDVFGSLPIDEVDIPAAEEVVDALLEERLEIEKAKRAGAPLKGAYRDPRTGKTHERDRKGLSNSSIKKGLECARRVLRYAHRRGLIDRVPDIISAAPKVAKPRRSFLQIEETAVALEAAQLLDQEGAKGLDWEKVAYIRASDKTNRALSRELGVTDALVSRVRRGVAWKGEPDGRKRIDVPHRASFQTLVLGGLRVAEYCGTDGYRIDLAAGRLLVPHDVTKTHAGERSLPMVPALREGLIAHRTDWPYTPDGPAFATRNGTRNTPDNVRAHVIAPIHEKANELLAARGRPPIAHMTPHTLRRTFASILAVCNVPPSRAKVLLGHEDSRLTMDVYQQVMDMGAGSAELLERLLGATLQEACAIFSGHGLRTGVLVTNAYPGQKNGSAIDPALSGNA